MKHELNLAEKRANQSAVNFLGKLFPRSEKLGEQLQTLWNHIYNDTRSLFKKEEAGHLHPRIDVLESKNIYDIRVDLPGVDANSIDVKSDGKTLLVKAKRSCNEPSDFKMSHCEHKAEVYERDIQLAPDAVIEEKSATFSDGILSIRVPRKAA